MHKLSLLVLFFLPASVFSGGSECREQLTPQKIAYECSDKFHREIFELAIQKIIDSGDIAFDDADWIYDANPASTAYFLGVYFYIDILGRARRNNDAVVRKYILNTDTQELERQNYALKVMRPLH